ncbi:hypothetical protein CVT26_011665 [Gymnopilus dilepis]|uniref:Aminotransferase class I/classII large domain-containing protein n=1 Tax=Gymnopilus dilepis TaxID=231916 RepID=A0A409W8W6_9AGAR|nr:hypothetical protein CVT26_011665 [Gymnopilus dilepis]
MQAPLGFRLSRGVISTIAPPIPRAYEWASRYKATPTHPLLDMSQGVPGLPPPEHVQTTLGAAASSPASFGYVRWDGEPTLREALIREMKGVYGRNLGKSVGPEVDVRPDDVALTAGCNLAFVAAIMTLADAGDEVILPVPWMTLNLLGVRTVPLQTRPEDGFTPSVDHCRPLITPKTKAIVLVTPNNPTGAVYSPELISAFASLSREKNVALVVDETYRDFIVDGSAPHALFSNPSWRDTFIHLFSFSKAYCLPGHRLGAIVASPNFLSSTKKVLDTVQICAPRPVQLALGPLLPSLRTFVDETAQSVHARHILFKGVLPPKWKIGSQGGYFAFVRHPFPRVRAVDVCRRLAEEVGVVTLPSAFFMEETEAEAKADGVNGELEAEDVDWAIKQGASEVAEADRWMRFSVANIDDEKVKRVCARLEMAEYGFEWTLEK